MGYGPTQKALHHVTMIQGSLFRRGGCSLFQKIANPMQAPAQLRVAPGALSVQLTAPPQLLHIIQENYLIVKVVFSSTIPPGYRLGISLPSNVDPLAKFS